MSRISVYLLAFVVFVLPGGLWAQSSISVVSFNGSNQTALIKFSSGTIVGVDNITQVFILSNESGDIFEVEFLDAVRAVEPDPVKQTALFSALVYSLNIPASASTLTDSTVPRLASVYNPRPPIGRVIPNGMGIQTISGSLSGLGGPCDLGPCSPYRHGDGRIFYMLDGGTSGAGTVEQQSSRAKDYDRWQKIRAGKCKEAREGYSATAATGAMTGGACLAFKTVAGALGCAGGSVMYVIQFSQARRADKACSADYPGEGSW